MVFFVMALSAQERNNTVFKPLKSGTSATVTIDVAKYDATTVLNLTNELDTYFQRINSRNASTGRANELAVATTKKVITVSYNDEIPLQDLIGTFKKHGVSCRPKK